MARDSPDRSPTNAGDDGRWARYGDDIYTEPEVETFHDQVGYWLWEPAAHVVTLTLAIPRGQVLLQTPGATGLFHHTDRNTLSLVAPPRPNPMARAT